MGKYELRTCYINCAEHLLNSQNANIIYDNEETNWSDCEWTRYIRQIKEFGFNNLQIWLPPTLSVPGETRDKGTKRVKHIMDICHSEGLSFNIFVAVNTIGGEWYFACPNDKEDRKKIFELFEYYIKAFPDVDIFTIFPGDPGGCNRRGCNHITYIELSAELAHLIKKSCPNTTVEVGTWGTPFSGWGEDLREVKNWDGTFSMLTDPEFETPEVPCHIWNGNEKRAVNSMRDLVSRLRLFPKDTMFSINSGFNPDAEPIGGFDGRPWAKEISKTHRVNSWDYSASEGELICYPHWRVEKYRRKRNLEVDSAEYFGAICYTMTPKLSVLMQYCAAQTLLNPKEPADDIASRFSSLVFGDEKIGLLMEAFEIVDGWGFEPRNDFSKPVLKAMFTELIKRLEMAEGFESKLTIFPSSEDYRKELLWHANNFLSMLGECDREEIKENYRKHILSIYENVPSAVDERSKLSAQGYASIGLNLK